MLFFWYNKQEMCIKWSQATSEYFTNLMERFDQSLLHKQQIAPGYNIIFYCKIL